MRFAALRHAHYRIFFIGGMLSMMGDNIEHVITYWLIFDKFESATLGGFAVISHWAPFLFLGMVMGALADRYDCRRIIQAAQLLWLGVSLAWAILIITDTIEMWHAAVLLVIHGLAGALNVPARQLILYDMVGREHLQSAIRLNAMSIQLGLLFGPAVGGGLLLLLGPSVGLIVNAFFYLPLALWLLFVPYTGHGSRTGAPAPVRLGLRDVVHVLRGVADNRTILSMVALAGLGSFIVGNAYQAQMPKFATDLLESDTGLLYTMLLTANAVGALAGGLVLEGLNLLRARARVAIVLAGLWCLAVAAFAVAPHYIVALVALGLVGLFHLSFSTMAMTLVQLEAPADHRGRVLGVFNMAQQGLRVGSGVTVGVMGAYVGVHWSLGLSAVALLALLVPLFVFAGAARRQEVAAPVVERGSGRP